MRADTGRQRLLSDGRAAGTRAAIRDDQAGNTKALRGVRRRRVPDGKDSEVANGTKKLTINHDLRKRSNGEKLWFWRRQKGLTQAEAGVIHSISEKRYCAIENDREEDERLVPWPDVPTSEGDLCALARRRERIGLWEAGRLAGISHVTLLAWERASDPRLRKMWEGRGYRF